LSEGWAAVGVFPPRSKFSGLVPDYSEDAERYNV